MDIVLTRLKEREKELSCLYSIEELLHKRSLTLDEFFNKLKTLIPPGWQHPTVCEVRIFYEDKTYTTEDFQESPWYQSADIIVDNKIVGHIQVYYTQFIRLHRDSQFLPEEQKLLNTIASLVSNYLFHKRLKKTLAYLEQPDDEFKNKEDLKNILPGDSDEHWKWRYHMVKRLSEKMDFDYFGVEGIYLIGSTKNANAGPGSDIDLLIHFNGDEKQHCQLQSWINGWSYGLDEINYMKTGYYTDGLIDLHIVTDEDIKNKTSYAVMIESKDNGAHPIKVRSHPNRK
ncbi:MAG: nucleotidyltransferase domain-containing protein [Bacteroidales bacterium]|nr:nucleotidyltransferase domain-containing protein [Bacteroidales bacterium]